MRLEMKAVPALALLASQPFETKTAARAMRIEPEAAPAGRRFKGMASTWDLDLGGDLIMRGAYAETLQQWKTSGQPIPLVDSHSYTSIFSILGQLVEAKETDAGLLTTFEVINGQDGDAVLERVRSGVVTGLSIGYSVPRGAARAPDARLKALGVSRLLDKVSLREVSLVMSPMNPYARVTSPNGKGLAPDATERLALESRTRELRAFVDGLEARERAEREAKLAKLKAWQAEHSWAPDHPERIRLASQLRHLRLQNLRLGIN